MFEDSEILPTGYYSSVLAADTAALDAVVLCWIGCSPIVEHSGNGEFAMPWENSVKDFANHSGGFLLNDEVAFLLRVLLYIRKGAEGPIWKPLTRRFVRTLRIFSDMSSRYHSFTSPLIWRDFLFPCWLYPHCPQY